MIDARLRYRVPDGEFTLDGALRFDAGLDVVFGPSGSGKSTLLALLLGARRPSTGSIRLDDRPLFDDARGIDEPPHLRRIGHVDQDALLFPHLTVAGNVELALRAGRAADGSTAEPWLERVGAAHLGLRRPLDLSGGERRRVALARALAARPRALLLDEPFAALDAPGRRELGRALVELQRETAIPFVLVTHDLGEALRLGRRLSLLSCGRVLQSGPGEELVRAPANAEAAALLGTENVVRGRFVAFDAARGLSRVEVGPAVIETGPLEASPGDEVVLGLRASDVLLAREPVLHTSARNGFEATVEALEPDADSVLVRTTAPGSLTARVSPAAAAELELAPGRRIWLLVKAHAFVELD